MSLWPPGGREDQGVRRGAEGEVVAVDLDPGSAMMGEAEIADDLTVNAIKNPVHTAMPAVGHAPVGGRAVSKPWQ